MNVIFTASEITPFARTGGLGDMVAALPKVLNKAGQNCFVFLPKYKEIDDQRFKIKSTGKRISVDMSGKITNSEIFETIIDNCIPVYFIESDEYFQRSGIYEFNNKEHPDNAERFAFFSKGCLCAIKELGISPDIIHCHDWPTGLIPVYLKTVYRNDNYFENTSTVFTIHNVVYQGIYDSHKMNTLGLPWEIFTPEGIEFYGKINLLKGGIAFADIITTVSKTYAREMQTFEFGNGLDGILRHRSRALYGIINGVDYDIWNPETDHLITKQFTVNDLSGKKECKKELLSIFDLKSDCLTPLIGMVARLDEQKGIDLLMESIHDLMDLDINICLLGVGKEKYHHALIEIAEKYKKRFGIKISFNNQMAHKIEAGADIFIMPSKYEPCGLNQLYSLKYGTIPVVRNIGGLADTINEYDHNNKCGNGFKFDKYSSAEFITAIKRALDVYNDKESWKKLMQNAMNEDFSWERSACKYLELYKKAQTDRLRGGDNNYT